MEIGRVDSGGSEGSPAVDRPDIDRLVILAAPSRAGKSYLIDRIRSACCPELCMQLGITEPGEWHYLTLKRMTALSGKTPANLVLHYDLYANLERGRSFANLDPLISSASSTSVLTLCASAETLAKRNALNPKRLANLLFLKKWPLRKKISRIRARQRKQGLYREAAHVLDQYTLWIDYLKGGDIDENWLMDCNRLTPLPAVVAYDEATLRRFVTGD